MLRKQGLIEEKKSDELFGKLKLGFILCKIVKYEAMDLLMNETFIARNEPKKTKIDTTLLLKLILLEREKSKITT